MKLGERISANPLTVYVHLCHTQYMNTNTATAAIFSQADDLDGLDLDGLDLDAFSTPTTVKIPASKIRECMVLTDPQFGTPLYWVDHRVRSTRSSGNVEFMAHNLETGRIQNVAIFANTMVAVIAA